MMMMMSTRDKERPSFFSAPVQVVCGSLLVVLQHQQRRSNFLFEQTVIRSASTQPDEMFANRK